MLPAHPDSRPGGTVRALALACHPLPTLGVTSISAGLAALAGLGFGRGALFTLAVMAGQLSIGWSNDWIDAARDQAVGRPDKPVARGVIPPGRVRAAAIVALVAAAALSMSLGWRAGLAALTLVGAGWLYNLGLKATVASWVPYAIGFGSLPAAATLALPGRPWPAWWAMTAGALLGVAAHAANVLPDLRSDQATGVRGFWHVLGGRATAIGGPVVLFAASLVVLLGPGAPHVWTWIALAVIVGLAGTGVAVGLRSPNSRLLFLATVALAGADLVLFARSGSRLTA
ncbi:4-hydroxybenzoate polyprenyltransferase [Nakamurella panacisegetis]|uniref:4-hydroxybenzoate polyprenyltransferase n=1 Tax=Nakamurella panacisegetis TaxID=1090615 RepID=A0A1H0KFM8_9ACTN|nr:UbiA family prenyltransferase [Nakamurella panacisegetis]SDO54646.1 4-hydroxybenzoate polyprenyltransferase [Nakamurella panacisegetis]